VAFQMLRVALHMEPRAGDNFIFYLVLKMRNVIYITPELVFFINVLLFFKHETEDNVHEMIQNSS
jgi:hypothetical protein